jgi:multidrug efflux pump
MPKFFIERPIFAWVIAIAIILAGLIAIPRLPVARYPVVAPPTVSIYASYPGATPQTMNDSVVGLIERELSSVKNLLYFEASTDTSGSATITATFKPGTNPELAQVDVQNRLKTVEPRLPQAVRQTGVSVESAASNFLMMVSLRSVDGRDDEVALSDYMVRNVADELKRIPGVGRVQMFGSERAMRIWVDPNKLTGLNLSLSDVTAAIAAQNQQLAPGALGGEPTVQDQRVTVPLTADGQLQTIEQFKAIVLRAATSGARVTLGDVARIELNSANFNFASRENGQPATALGVQLSPGGNAVRTAAAIQARLDELQRAAPAGMKLGIPFNTAPFVRVSIEKVVQTLVEAMALVFLVMFLFLQKVRYTLIPAIVAPIALLGAFTVMLAAGFSINVLTMFGMVLAIGIIVDDAIVVVEAVERIMATEGLSPKEATRKAMSEMTGAIIGITAVLSAVFIPMALADGSVGAIYRQFTLSMAVSILFSAFLALSLTPALCATLLKPIDGHAPKTGFFAWFDRHLDRLTERYERLLGGVLRRGGRAMAAFAVVVAIVAAGFAVIPSAFLPEEDQGYFITSFQLPADATARRTNEAVSRFEHYARTRPGIETTQAVTGFSFAGQGPNAAMVFTMLKDWKNRDSATSAGEVKAATEAMMVQREGQVMSVMPPSIDELGNSSGFTLALQDRANRGPEALGKAQARLLELAAQSKLVTGVYPEGLPPGSTARLEIDRQKAQALGVSFPAVADTLSTALGSSYVNDFVNGGRLQQVIVQADAPFRMQLSDVLKLYVRNETGGMVALSEVVTPVWTTAPAQMTRFNGYPSVRLTGSPAPGASSGQAMAELERLATQLPQGYTVAWTGQSLQEKLAGAQAPALLALSMLVVFLVLAALYESWSIPLSVMLAIPLGLVGALAAVLIRGLPNDIFFKVGLITIIGLSAKNAILIVEFAKASRAQGMALSQAAIHAAKLRLRPIVMTSLAFTLGVVPLVIASGASAETQHAIGTGVFGGMITGTVLTVVLVPLFFVLVVGAAERLSDRRRAAPAEEA